MTRLKAIVGALVAMSAGFTLGLYYGTIQGLDRTVVPLDNFLISAADPKLQPCGTNQGLDRTVVPIDKVLISAADPKLQPWSPAKTCGHQPSRVPADIGSLTAALESKADVRTLFKNGSLWDEAHKIIKAKAENEDSNDAELHLLIKAVRWVSQQRLGKPVRSVETGMAYGKSATAIVSALVDYGTQAHHSAADPYQELFHHIGRDNVEQFLSKFPSDAVKFNHLNLPASIVLSKMYELGECIDFAYLDDGHLYDDNMIELYYVNLMMPPGGIIFIDDHWMSSVKATVSFMETNLGFQVVSHGPWDGACIGLMKMNADYRAWNHYADFQSHFLPPPDKTEKRKTRKNTP